MDDTAFSTRFLVGGDLVSPAGEAAIPARDPARDRHLADVPVADDEDVDRAVAAARDAFEGWRDADPADRASVLRAVADCLRENAEQLVDIEVANNGSTRGLLRDDVDLAIEWLTYYAGLTGSMMEVLRPHSGTQPPIL